jgi:hypothetical protein
MSWLVHAERFETADMTPPFRVYMPFSVTQKVRLKALRTWIVVYNDPVFTSIEMRLYSSRNGVPQKLLNTSNAILKATLHTLDHGCKEVGFEFDNAEALEADREIILVPYITGYTGNDSSHLAWRREYEDYVYSDVADRVYKNLLLRPYHVAFVGELVK